MNKHVGSSFDEHFKEQFKDPEFAYEIYKQSETDLDAALAKIEELKLKLLIETAEVARLYALIKRRGF